MLLVFGTAGLALSAVAFGIALIGCRNPRPPAWARDYLIGSVHLPVIMGLALAGVGCFARYLMSPGRQWPGLVEIGLMIGIAAAAFAALKLLRVRQRLADYEATEKAAEIIRPAAFLRDGGQIEAPDSPAAPTAGKQAA